MICKNKVIQIIYFSLTAYSLSLQPVQAESKKTSCQSGFPTKLVKRAKSVTNKRKLNSLKLVSHSGNQNASKTKGVESYHEALVREFNLLLGREANEEQMEAIKKANLAGKDKNEIARSKEKTKILKEAGFSKKEIRELMENDIVWIEKQDPGKLLIENLRKGNRKGKKYPSQ